MYKPEPGLWGKRIAELFLLSEHIWFQLQFTFIAALKLFQLLITEWKFELVNLHLLP